MRTREKPYVGALGQLVRLHWDSLLVFTVLLLVALVRIRLLDFPLERDEGEYAYAGQLILQGIPPYKLAYNMKFPGTYLAYAVIMLVFGQTPAGIHLGVTCVTTLTALMLYWFGRALIDKAAGVVAATSYALLAASPSLLGLAGHATHFAALLATAGLCVLWPIQGRMTWPRAGLGGLMFGLAVLMKQHAAFFCLWGLAVVCATLWSHRTVPLCTRVVVLVTYCLGVLSAFGLTCLVLWQEGVFDQFWFWTVKYAKEYVSLVPLEKGLVVFLNHLPCVVKGGELIWLTALAGVAFVLADTRFYKRRIHLLGFCLAAIGTTMPGFYFRGHYFLLLAPAVAILAGCAASGGYRLAASLAANSPLVRGYCLVYLAIVGITIFQNRVIWFKANPVEAARAIYPTHPFVEAQYIADYIRTHSAPEDTVAILGSEPQIYFLSRRRSATGYIYTYALMEPHRYASCMQQRMISEIESARPEFVVFVSVETSWLPWPGADTGILHWWANSYQTNYTVVGVALMNATADTQYLWGEDARQFYQEIKLGADSRPMVLLYKKLRQ